MNWKHIISLSVIAFDVIGNPASTVHLMGTPVNVDWARQDVILVWSGLDQITTYEVSQGTKDLGIGYRHEADRAY